MPDKKDHRLKISVVEEKKEEEKEIVTPAVDENKPEIIQEPTLKIEENKPEIKEEKKDPLETQIEQEEKQTIPFWVLFLAFLLGLALGAGIVGGLFFYKSKMLDVKSTPTPTSTSKPVDSPQMQGTPVSSPSASPAALKNIKVNILNGTGVKGAAAKVEALITAAGFEDITVGNASTFNFTKTVIQIKKDVGSEVLKAIQKALGDTYELEEKDPTKTQTSDVIITVGKTLK